MLARKNAPSPSTAKEVARDEAGRRKGRKDAGEVDVYGRAGYVKAGQVETAMFAQSSFYFQQRGDISILEKLPE